MLRTAGDSIESFLSRYRLRLLVDEWLEVVARTEPEDPFAYLVDLIKDYTRDGGGLVTCENKWCEMVVPVSEYAEHLKSCSEEGKWMKCARCNVRVEASHMQEHRRHCRLQCCAYCGEMVVPRLMGLCPYKLRMDVERARRRRKDASIAQGNNAGTGGETRPPLLFHSPLKSKPGTAEETSISLGAPLYSRVPMRFPSALRNRLICFQQLWRKASVKERLQDLTFKYVWEALELYRERQATRDNISGSGGKKKEIPLRDFSRVAAATAGSISMAQFEAVAETTTSEQLVDFATAVRIVTNAIIILASRSLVQRVTIPEGGDVVVIGDLHGQMKDLREIRALVGALPNRQRYFVFNGDFVDRGANGMEVILYIFSLLCAFPEFVFINRGNHEDAHVNTEYGFETEVYSKYGLEDAKHLLELLVTSYEAMPLMTVLDGAVLILHGGVPRSPITLDRIEGMSRIRNIPVSAQATEEEQITVDILWNDPVEKFRSRQLGLRHQGENWRTSKRGCGVEYLAPVTESFLRLNNLKLVVRSHEMVHAGYELIHNGRCCTVFSASNYAGVSGNRAALALFQKGSLNPVFHTWYVRDEEGAEGVSMGKKLLIDLEAPGLLNGGNDDDDDDDEDNSDDDNDSSDANDDKPDDTTSVNGKNVNKTDEILSSEEKNDSKVDDKLKNKNRNGRGSLSSLDLDIPVEGQLLYRLNVLRTLGEIVYRKRYALLSAFVSADYKESGIILKIEWCDVMRNVLEMDLPWYYLCQFLAEQQEVDGVFCVRYVHFLKNFGARFSTQYLRPFQVAVVCRVFKGMDMPDDLLSRMQDMHISTTSSISPAASPSHAGEEGDLLYSTSTETHTLLKRKGNFPTKEEGLTPSLGSRHVDAEQREVQDDDDDDDDDDDEDIGRRKLVKMQKGVQESFDSHDKWRDLKLSFNLFVSTLRSQSSVAASFEDNVMYAMFLYFDVNECGHVFLGDLNDIVETILEKEEEGSVQLLGSGASFNVEFDFGTEYSPNTTEKQITDKDTDATTNVSKEKKSKSVNGEEILSSLVISCNESNTGRRKSTREEIIRRASSLDSHDSNEDSMSEALWLYPALLRLHEYLDYGSLWSLPHIFKCLNRTGDGKLTFEQLNIVLQLVGRHMPQPFTPEQCRSIFRAIRDVGEHLYRNRHNDSLADTRSLYSTEGSAPTLLSESLSPKSDADGTVVDPNAYITPEEFVAFFAVSVVVPRRRGSYSTTTDGSRTMGPDEELPSRRRSGLPSSVGSVGTGIIGGSVGSVGSVGMGIGMGGGALRGWTVGALAARFDPALPLPQALQGLLGLTPPSTPPPAGGFAIATASLSSIFSPGGSVWRGVGEQTATNATAAEGSKGKEGSSISTKSASTTNTKIATNTTTNTTTTTTTRMAPAPAPAPMGSPQLGVQVPVGRKLNAGKKLPEKGATTNTNTNTNTTTSRSPSEESTVSTGLARTKTRAFSNKNATSSNTRANTNTNTKSTTKSKTTAKNNPNGSRSASGSTSTNPNNSITSTSANTNASSMSKYRTNSHSNTNSSTLTGGNSSTSNSASARFSINANASTSTNPKSAPNANANANVSRPSNDNVSPALDANSSAAVDSSSTIINANSATTTGNGGGIDPLPSTTTNVLWKVRGAFDRTTLSSRGEYTQSTRGSKENSNTVDVFASSLPQSHADGVPIPHPPIGVCSPTKPDRLRGYASPPTTTTTITTTTTATTATTTSTSTNQQEEKPQQELPPVRGPLTRGANLSQQYQHYHHLTHSNGSSPK